MLPAFEQTKELATAETRQIECDKWKHESQEYLRRKDLDGAQGGYKSYAEYVITINALNAMDKGDVAGFEKWFAQLGKICTDTVTVSFNGLPRNPYSDSQPRNGCEQITFYHLAQYYEKNKGRDAKCTTLLKEKFAPQDGSVDAKPEKAVRKPGLF